MLVGETTVFWASKISNICFRLPSTASLRLSNTQRASRVSPFSVTSQGFPWFFHPWKRQKFRQELLPFASLVPSAQQRPEPGPAAARPLRARPAAAAALDGAAHGGAGHAQQRCLRWAVWGGSGGGSHTEMVIFIDFLWGFRD